MATSQWAGAVKAIRDHVLLIETPGVRGTGFVIQPPPGTRFSTITTAMHVIVHAHEWREPLKLTHFPSGKQAFLDVNSRVINLNPSRDMAIIHFSAQELPLPNASVPFLEINKRLNEGVETGWLGFPAVAPSNLCFFCGHISAWLQPDEAYLVDGVAINGVSGGPAFMQDNNGKPVIIGLVTEYRPNFATGNVLPGVSLIRSIDPLVQHYAQLQKQIPQAKVQDIPPAESKGGLPTNPPMQK